VQSVALASFGFEIDRRIVSVVQLGPTESPAAEAGLAETARIGIGALQIQMEGRRTTIRVTLTSGGVEATGFGEGSIAASTRLRLVASAALDALRQLDEAAGAIDVDDVAVTHVGSQEIVAVTLVHVDPPDERVLVGAALARQAPDIAAVRAVLDAVNRRLPYLPSGPSLR
jgi:hypothetical protein